MVILSILYKRMIDRDQSAQISKKQAIVPVLLGIVSTYLSFGIFIGVGLLFIQSGYVAESTPVLLRSFIGAFIMAGLPEELSKLLMILLALYLFRSTVTNVYEYVLIGMAVGFGFTLFEETLYGSGGAIFRLTGVAMHSAINMIMAKHLALAKYHKRTNNGSVAGEYALAILLPVLIHSLYDMCTANNKFLECTEPNLQLTGLILGILAAVLGVVIEVVVFVKTKQDAPKQCEMRTVESAVK